MSRSSRNKSKSDRKKRRGEERREEERREEEVKNLFTELQDLKKHQTILHGFGNLGTKFQNIFPLISWLFVFFIRYTDLCMYGNVRTRTY
jgi:hypothetical protein